IFLFILLSTVVFGCVRNNKIPKEIIRQNEMRKIMWDLMRADAYVADFIMKDSTCDWKAESAILYEKIFDIHSTTRETFKKSLAFYESRPDLLKVIADSLRSDENKTQQYPDQKKPQVDTTLRKMKFNKKLTEKKP
ncbi:MAG TPA: DUF4296 domain-containing protein, partial [Chitinophagaceae bacterium]|nr:DUF4296 domain-containing protein [Chitinophagaceae bacterium]